MKSFDFKILGCLQNSQTVGLGCCSRAKQVQWDRSGKGDVVSKVGCLAT
jgi:hypothetical protein